MGNRQNKPSRDPDDHRKRGEGEIKRAIKQEGIKGDKPHLPGDGIRSMRTTGVFRAVNFELYARPSKPVMIIGALSFTLCLGYITYMRSQYKKDDVYEALAEDGTTVLRPRKSRWES